jgi:hypothetical protein
MKSPEQIKQEFDEVMAKIKAINKDNAQNILDELLGQFHKEKPCQKKHG